MNTFSFNKIIIVQSLSLDPALNSYRIGAQLKADIDSTLVALTPPNVSITCDLVEIHSIADWHSFISSLRNDCRQGQKPILHFICHGSTSHIALDGVPGGLEWSRFVADMESINVLTSNNLFVSLCVCYGFYSMLHLLDERYRIPFCGLVSCPYPLHVFTAAQCFPAFYRSLLTNRDINHAKQALYTELQKLATPNPANPSDDLYVEFTDDLFMKAVLGDYKKNRMNPASRRENAIKALKDSGHNYKDQALINKFLAQETQMLFGLYRNLRDYKFMLDKNPADKSRYNMPDDFRVLLKSML